MKNLTQDAAPAATPAATPADVATASTAFVPREPTSFAEAGLREPQVEALVLRFLLHTGSNTGREIAEQIALPFAILQALLQSLRNDQLVAYSSTALVGDFVYELTPRGAERARLHAEQSTYFGSAPVSLNHYAKSVEAQSCRHHKPRLDDVKRTFASLILSQRVVQQLGEALHLGWGLFLHGAPGNGKTSIAELLTAIYSEGIWIPRAIQAGGEIIRVFDSSHHERLPWSEETEFGGKIVDARWVYIRRPTIIVGSELRLENLEVTTNRFTKISEAPLQLKSNCGTFVIDDFGRQSFPTKELLNRLMLPLERRTDVVNLPSGRSFNTPFDNLIVFATNLAPESLVGETFLRRVPCTILVEDPTEGEFREVFRSAAKRFGLTCDPAEVEYLLETHYRQPNRQIRGCHPRDLLQQIANSCAFLRRPKVVTRENIDAAVRNCLALRSVVSLGSAKK